jgi:hypothetical protein
VSTRGAGKTIQWIRDHAAYPHEDWCLIWPFSTTRGYGHFVYLQKGYYAHRFMCELAHGPAPSDLHEAAHSCGDEGCVNPRHLSWKTPGQNGLDCRKHGTHVRSRYGSAGKITAEQAEIIRGFKGIKTLRELADEYGISESAISNVWVGKTHYRPSKLAYWTPEQDALLRNAIAAGRTHKEAAALVGKSEKAASGRVARLKATPQSLANIGGLDNV